MSDRKHLITKSTTAGNSQFTPIQSSNSTSSISASSNGNYIVYSKTPSATKSATLGTVASGELTTTFNSYISTALSAADYLDISNKTDTVAYAMLEGIEDGDTTITVSV